MDNTRVKQVYKFTYIYIYIYIYIYTQHISHTGHTFQDHLWGMYMMHIRDATYEVSILNHVNRSTKYILCKLISCYWHISLSTYDYDIANIGHTALILHLHIHLIVVDISAKIQPPTSSTSHLTALYLPVKYIPNFTDLPYICRYILGCLHIYVLHTKLYD